MALEVSDGISMLALLLSVWASAQSYRTNKKMISLQKPAADLAALQLEAHRREEREKTIPVVSAYWYQATRDSRRIAVCSRGNVAAYDVTFAFHPNPGADSVEVRGTVSEMFPISIFKPGAEVNFPISENLSTGESWPVEITWKSESGESFRKNIELGPAAT